MPDLNTQLREYFDATAPPLEVEEVVGDEVLVPGGRKTPSRRWTRPGLGIRDGNHDCGPGAPSRTRTAATGRE